MFHVINTVIPVFGIILLGCALKLKGLFPANVIGPLNRIVYYLAIPTMIFREVATADFESHFSPVLLAGTLAPVILVFLIVLGLGMIFAVPRERFGTFLQCSFHGNLGYIGLAIAYYLLGEEGFTGASFLCGFLMVLQNLCSVFGLQLFGSEKRRLGFFIKKILGNPVVVSALAGIFFSLAKIPIPEVIDRSLKILSGMALPLALLVIGASISFGIIKSHYRLTLCSGFLKLLVLPGIGLLMYLWLGVPNRQFLPGLILLASPPATISYVMASEMHGSVGLATAAVSMNTLLSALTFVFWLSLLT
jgi:malate permease and related proteins